MKKLKGIVVRQTMDKTAVVRVDRDWRHPIYHKTVKRSKKYLVHDPEGKAQVNKKIVIAETVFW